jgi:hypothetical protein
MSEVEFNILLIKEHLKNEIFGDDFDIFNMALHKCNAVIAGGSVLSVYTSPSFEYGDIDMYVPHEDAIVFIKNLLNLKNCKVVFHAAHTSPAYDDSFLKRNNILYRLSGTIFCTISDNKKRTNFDIMVTGINASNVVTNFDLSCCQIWYDGRSVQATDFNDDKKAHLRLEYHEAWIKGNWFLRNRVSKYQRRGFKITMEIKKKMTIDLLKKKQRHILNYEEWVVINIINFIFKAVLLNMSTDRYEGVPQKDENIDIILQGLKIRTFNVENIKPLLENYCKQHGMEEGALYHDAFWFVYFDANHVIDMNKREQILKVLEEKFGVIVPYEQIMFYALMLGDLKHARGVDLSMTVDKELICHVGNLKNKQQLPAVTSDIIKIKKTDDATDLLMFEKIKIQDCLGGVGGSKNVFFRIADFTFFVSRETLLSLVCDKSNWLYECVGRKLNDTDIDDRYDRAIQFNDRMIYVKFPIAENGHNGFFRIDDIYALVSSKSNCFEIIQYANAAEKMITHSISYNNTKGTTRNYISANHCQYGSNVLIYQFLEHPKLEVGVTLEGGNHKHHQLKFFEKQHIWGRMRNVYKLGRKTVVKCNGDILTIKDFIALKKQVA